ncbi:MAG: M23 family metallopeptidase [Leptospiraceae bacterium]|nr:M23 family metallopeptidase [Leptospiraceae bacterium]MCK6382578.1 M23 family metallopeptidase [Leptospiraceae bacterium]NUM42117.1 M23 family metallopeptidase [Leptospiraceae bacterium]
MKIIKLTAILLPLLILANLLAFSGKNSSKQEIMIDNEFIQTYRDKHGRWASINEIKQSTEKFLKEIGTEEIEVKFINDIKITDSLPKFQQLFFPYSEDYLKSLLSSGKGREIVVSDFREFIWPVSSSKIYGITSKLGKRWNIFHSGLDIACSKGSVVVAAADGTVIYSRVNAGNYGNLVTIQHEINNLQSMYAHNSTLLVKEGEKVKKGQIIAFSGNTGHSTGPHLHFEVKYLNVVLNPEHYLPMLIKNTDPIVASKEE